MNITVGDKVIKHYLADVDLWHCKDCGVDLYHDWGPDSWTLKP